MARRDALRCSRWSCGCAASPPSTPTLYVDITVRNGLSLEEAREQARQTDEARWAAGFDQGALDKAARLGFSNGAFEDSVADRRHRRRILPGHR